MRDGWGADWRGVGRWLRRRPGGAIAVMVLLGLGIGAAAALIAPLDSLLLAPLPLPRSGQLVHIGSGGIASGDVYNVFTNSFPHRRALEPVFSHVAAYWGAGAGAGTAVVTPDFFATVGVLPQLGRGFPASPAAGTAVVSYQIWRSRLGGETDLTGLALALNGQRYRVVGVMPRGFDFPGGTQVWLPGESAPFHVVVIGRLREGVSLQEARVRLRVLAADKEFGGRPAPRLQPLGKYIAGSRGTLALEMWLVSLLFFLLACIGAAYLLWARAAERGPELQIRAALGAAPWRLARLAMAEPLALAAAGAGLGLLLAWQGGRILARAAPELAPAGSRLVPLSWVCAVALGLIAAALCGCPGAWRAVRARMDSSAGDLRPQQRNWRGRGWPGRWLAGPRQWAQAGQVALAMVLLVAGGLLWRSLWTHLNTPLGFNPQGVMLLRVNLPPLAGAARAVAEFQRRRKSDPALEASQDAELVAAIKAEAQRNERFYRRATRTLAARPGVGAVGSIQPAPFGKGAGFVTAISAQGPEGPGTTGLGRVISPGGFRLLGMRMLAGRGFSGRDVSQAATAVGKNLFQAGGMTGTVAVAAVVNKKLARQFWPQGRALGHELWWGSVLCRVVGVVADIRENPRNLRVRPTVYLPYGWNPYGEPFLNFAIRVRAAGAPGLAAAAGAALAAIAPGLPPPAVTSLSTQVAQSWKELRTALGLLGIFAVLGLVVAGLGVYACAADGAAADRREMGIRAALGAAPGEIWWEAQGRNLRMAGVAIAAGAGGAWMAARALSHWLFGVGALDAATYVAAGVLLLAVAVAAAAGPAGRAARCLPAEVLRE